MSIEELVDHGDYLEVCLGTAQWQELNGSRYILEEDFPLDGEVWRVHLSDADPFPSKPHAHCVGGKDRFIGCTLHLGSGQLFRKRDPLNRRLESRQFERLCDLLKNKFPNIKFPLHSAKGNPCTCAGFDPLFRVQKFSHSGHQHVINRHNDGAFAVSVNGEDGRLLFCGSSEDLCKYLDRTFAGTADWHVADRVK